VQAGENTWFFPNIAPLLHPGAKRKNTTSSCPKYKKYIKFKEIQCKK